MYMGATALRQAADMAAAVMQIKKKMTQEEFVRNNRGINGTKDNPQDLPPEFLTELYNHFSEKAIRFPQLPATLSDKYSNSVDSTVVKCATCSATLKDRMYTHFIKALPFQHPRASCQPLCCLRVTTTHRHNNHEVPQSPPQLAL
jgi:hypothetical protein